MAVWTLAQALRDSAVPTDQLDARYRPVIAIVRELIGVVPNCNPYLEIWPPAFRTFNVLIPNLLNLPAVLMGQGAPKDLVGLAMYVSSRETGCRYCTAHHCSFALRRGARLEAILDEDYDDVEGAVADLATGLAQVPATLTSDTVELLHKHLDERDVEWVLLAVAMSGFLTKLMDTLGIELEHETINDVEPLIGDRGWIPGKHQWLDELPPLPPTEGIPVDDFATILRVMRRAPGAVRLGSRWTKGVSGRVAPALMMLEEHIGYAFPVLSGLRSRKAVKAVAAALRASLDPATTNVGFGVKCMVAVVYAETVGDELLRSEAVLLASLLAPDVDPQLLAEVSQYARAGVGQDRVPAGLSTTEAAALQLARAAAPSPVEVNEITISTAVAGLSAEQIVEIVSWMAVLQMLHRLYVFQDARLGLL